MNKKGFEFHFHWILVLIAGAIILFFFFSVVQKQRALSQERLSITLSTDIEAVFSGAVESKGTSQLLTVPHGGIAFSCTDVCDCRFWLGKKSTQFKDKIIFAPDFLNQGKAFAWSLDWKMPFRATNFLFLMNPEDKYFLVMDESNSRSKNLFKQLNKSLPGDIVLNVISSSEISGLVPINDVKYRFILLDNALGPPFGLSNEFEKSDVSVVYVNSIDKTVTFYEKDKRDLDFTPDTSLYAGEPGIFAAFFAQDKDMFECGLKKGFARLSVVAEILSSRADNLESEAVQQNRTDCVYSAPNVDYLRDIVNNAKELSLSSSFVEDSNIFANLAGNVDGIDSLNRNLIQKSCPGPGIY